MASALTGICVWFFLAAILLTVAMFLPPRNSLLMILWILYSFGVVVVNSWLCSRIARRRPVSHFFVMQMHFHMLVAWGFIVYSTFYRGFWAAVHSSDHFAFELRWKSVLFISGGLIAYWLIKKLSDVLKAIQERIRLFEAGRLPMTDGRIV